MGSVKSDLGWEADVTAFWPIMLSFITDALCYLACKEPIYLTVSTCFSFWPFIVMSTVMCSVPLIVTLLFCCCLLSCHKFQLCQLV